MFWRIAVTLFTTLTIGIVSYFWIAPLLVLDRILITSLCTLGGFALGLIINKICQPWIGRAPQQQTSQLQPTVHQTQAINKKNWIERALRNSRTNPDVRNTLITNLQNFFHGPLYHGLESLDAWVDQNLSSGEPALISIRNRWIANNDSDRVRIFRRHLERQPQAAHCYKLKDMDFKNIMPEIESFLAPPISKTDFEREMLNLGYNYNDLSFKEFIILLAREGRLAYLKFAIHQLDQRSTQDILPWVILAAAKNNHLPIVKEFVDISNPSHTSTIKQIFVMAIKQNNKNMIRWLLTKYSDEELKSDELGSLSIEKQIEFHSATPSFFSYTNNDPPLKTYQEVRPKRNLLT